MVFNNTQAVSRTRVPVPTGDWGQLLDEAYSGHIVMPHPATSETTYSAIATILQNTIQRGGTEEDGWDFVGRLAQNVARILETFQAVTQAAPQ